MVGALGASWQLLPTIRAAVTSGVQQAANMAAIRPRVGGAAPAAHPNSSLTAVGQHQLGELFVVGGSIAGAAALAALLVHLAMVRSGWLPRRPRQDAAVVPNNMVRRVGATVAWTLTATVSLLVLVGWVWRSAPVLAAPLHMVPATIVFAACARALAITVGLLLVAIGALHLLMRSWHIHRAQLMTKPELTREQREASVSPAIRQALRRLAGQPAYVPTLVCYDHAHAVAIAWHAATMTSPVLVWHRRDAASRHAVRDAQRTGTAVRRDVQLTAALRSVASGAVIPHQHWPALATAVAQQKP